MFMYYTHRLYPTASLMNHDCVPNTWHVFDCSSLRIRVLATVDILPGSKITATYTQSLWNTLDRRGHLKTCKHFWCTCGRCSDPKELGTMLSALSCRSKDCTGLAFSTDPLDHGAMWKCTTCQTTFSDAKDRHDAIRKELKDLVPQSRSCPQLMEDFVRKYSSHIHPSSCHVVEAKFALIQLMGNSSVHLVYHSKCYSTALGNSRLCFLIESASVAPASLNGSNAESVRQHASFCLYLACWLAYACRTRQRALQNNTE